MPYRAEEIMSYRSFGLAKSRNEYMTHFNSLLLKQEAVRRRVIYETTRDINEFFFTRFRHCCARETTVPHVCPSRRRVCGFELGHLYAFARVNFGCKLFPVEQDGHRA